MKIALKKTLFAALLGLCALIAIGGVLLIYPGTPGEAKSLAFKGYVLLPTAALLTVLDYMNVADTRLFVTDVSTGSVYKIALRNRPRVCLAKQGEHRRYLRSCQHEIDRSHTGRRRPRRHLLRSISQAGLCR